MSDEPTTVLLIEDVRLDPRELAGDVAAALGLPSLEARMRLRRTRGVVVERVCPPAAERVRAALERRGLRAEAVPAARLPRLPRPMRVAYLQRTGELLGYQGAEPGSDGAVAWADLGIVCAAPIGLETYRLPAEGIRFGGAPNLTALEDAEARELLRENLILALRDAQESSGRAPRSDASLLEEIETRYASSGVKVFLDLLSSDLSLWLRVSMDESSYRFQAEDVRLGGAMGMTHLLRDLLERAPQARFAPAVAALLEPTELERLIVGDVEEFSSYTAWLAYRRWLQNPPPPAADIDEPSNGGEAA